MGFLVLAKHDLNKTWIRANLVSFLRDQTVEREKGREKERRRGEEEKREEEEEEEKKKMKERRSKAKKVWNYDY